MTADPYARSARRWALGAELVYGPIAVELVALAPHPLAGRIVLGTAVLPPQRRPACPSRLPGLV